MMCTATTTEQVLTRSSLPSRTAAAPWSFPLTNLLEREAEIQALDRVLERGGCAFVRGPAGIGKTALLAVARHHARVPVLTALGSDLETELAFGGVRQLLGDVSGDFRALYWVVADRGPLVLLVDDAHWLDKPTLRWLAFMVNRVRDLP